MIILNLNPMSKIPLHQQVFTNIKEMIENNMLKVGSKLPASRVLAKSHGISRTVVYRSYQELWSQGYLESRPGSYSIVRKKTPNINLNQRASKSLIDWNTAITEESKDVYDTVSKFPDSSSEFKFENFIDMGCSGANAAQAGILMGYKKIILIECDANYDDFIEGSKIIDGGFLTMEKTPDKNPNYWFIEH